MAGLIRGGNIKLVLCFVCYLAWWVVAFNPVRPTRGLRSGWLLIPAFILGTLALFDIVRGLAFTGGPIPGIAIVAAGVVSYLVLLFVTGKLLDRPVTSELLIIVLWATVVVLETNTLVALGSVSLALGVGLAVLCILCAVASIVCYQRFYALEAAAAFVDGSIPLVLAVVMTGALAICAG